MGAGAAVVEKQIREIDSRVDTGPHHDQIALIPSSVRGDPRHQSASGTRCKRNGHLRPPCVAQMLDVGSAVIDSENGVAGAESGETVQGSAQEGAAPDVGEGRGHQTIAPAGDCSAGPIQEGIDLGGRVTLTFSDLPLQTAMDGGSN